MINTSMIPFHKSSNTDLYRRLTLYCATCKATSTFVRIEQREGWTCVGDATMRREGCGKHLREK